MKFALKGLAKRVVDRKDYFKDSEIVFTINLIRIFVLGAPDTTHRVGFALGANTLVHNHRASF